MFHAFTQLVADASGWAYLILFLFAFLDVLVPIVPSETAVITAGVVAASGDLSLALIIPAAAVGAFLGDNTVYLIGRRFGGRVTERFFSGEKATERMAWAEVQLSERGGELIVVARFIPGGRTAVALSAGTLGYPVAALRRVRPGGDAHLGLVRGAARLLRRPCVRELLGTGAGTDDRLRDRRRNRARPLVAETAPQAAVVTGQRPGFVPAAIFTGAGTA